MIASALSVSNVVPATTTEPSALQDSTSVPQDDALTEESKGHQCSDKSLDFDLLATRAQLLTAFEIWGLKPSWFNELNSHLWLKAARRFKGQGQRGHVVEPLFCPLAVMGGLVTSIRGRKTPMSPEKGWDILDHHFPNVSHANSFAEL